MRAVTQTVDGRTARSARTREAVVTAVLELVRAGNPRPTAKEIAARAGISLRSVYVHFDDLDDLFAAAGARQAEEVAHLLYAVDAGSAARRADRRGRPASGPRSGRPSRRSGAPR